MASSLTIERADWRLCGFSEIAIQLNCIGVKQKSHELHPSFSLNLANDRCEFTSCF
jgi:hypothetical protein